MAKNLKLNIKNAQLAEALNLGKFKRKKEPSSPNIPPTEEKSEEFDSKATSAAVLPPSEEAEISKPSPASSEEPAVYEEPKVAKTKPKEPIAAEPPTHPKRASDVEVSEQAPSKPEEPKSPFTRGYGPTASPPQQERPQPRPPQRDTSSREGSYRPHYEDRSQGRPDTRPDNRPDGRYDNRSGGYPPRPYTPRPDTRSDARPGYDSRRDSRPPYQPREGGYSSSQRPPYPPRPAGSGSGYPPRPGQGSGSGYPPRPGQGSGSGYPPRQGSGYPPRPGQGSGYPPRQGSGYPPRQGTGQYGSEGSFGGQSPRHGTLHRPGERPYSDRPYSERPYNDRPLGPIPPRPETKILDKEIIRSAKPVVRSYAEEEEQKRKAAAKEFKDVRPAKKAPPKAFDSRDKHGLRDTENEEWRRARNKKAAHHVAEIPVIRPKSLKVKIPITVKDLAAEMKLKASQLVAKLFMTGVVVTLNDLLEDETTIQLLGHEFECEIQIDRSEEERLQITGETIKEEVTKTEADKLVLRPPVVAFMGHVDHGKTSLIDAIRKSNVAQGEAGAITQHIGAFQAATAVGKITILDTPGHEAFSEMRARGADVTDIVVLVVAGDEGIKAQTVEAMEQAKAANVPIVVAINKCDKPGFNPENVYRQLADQNLLPEAWGGSTITVNCSAVTKEGIKELLEMLALQAEVLELRANPTYRARGTVIESEMHKGLGAVATLLVQNGTLRIGDAIVFTTPWARVKTMKNEYGLEITEAPPSTPVKITGLSSLPEAGSEFIAVRSEKEARELSESRSAGQKHIKAQSHKKSLEMSAAQAKKILYLIIKADVQGSLEAMKSSLAKIKSDKAELIVISSGIGQITESDVELAAASKAVILGFHSDIESHAVDLVRQHKVQVKIHDIIYHAVDDVKLHMKSLLDKLQQENDTGKAEVKAVFKSSHLGNICGCQVIEGTIHRNDHIKVLRKGEVVWKGPINSLKRVKEDVREVTKGIECGILISYQDIQEGDILQGFGVSYLEQEL